MPSYIRGDDNFDTSDVTSDGVASAYINVNSGNDSIGASYNVSSVTDSGQSAYYINFITPMSSTTYSTVGACYLPYNGSNGSFFTVMGQETNRVRLGFVSAGAAYYSPIVGCAIYQ